MKSVKKEKTQKLIYIIILVIFIVLSLYIGTKHEPWADEANAWLLAKDATIKELLTRYLHSDGHPILWHLIIKLFQLIGLKYKYFYIIPIIFSSMGIFILLFKSKFPIYIKCLLPFSYFIFYQYTVISRGYCIIFLLLSLLAVIWPKRYSSPIPFLLILFLLINLELYTYVFAFGITCEYIYEYVKNKQYNKKVIICIIMLILSFVITALYTMPLSSNMYHPSSSSVYLLSDSFFTNCFGNEIFRIISSIFLFGLMIIRLVQKPNNIKNNLLIIGPPLLLFLFFYINKWHLGIPFLLFIFIVWIKEIYNEKYVKILLIISIAAQLTWTYKSVLYDIKNDYCAAEKVSIKIKDLNKDNLKIVGFAFYSSAINPYFNNNIFINYEKDFFYWNKNTKYYKHKYDDEYFKKENPDIIIIPTFLGYDIKNLEIVNNYNMYYYKASTFIETQKYEDMSIKLYIKKDLDNLR